MFTLLKNTLFISIAIMLWLFVIFPFFLKLFGIDIPTPDFGAQGGSTQETEVLLRSVDAGASWENAGRSAREDMHFPSRILTLVPHPSLPSLLYLGSSDAGLWATQDSGASWFPVRDPTGALKEYAAVNKIAVMREDPLIVYMAAFQDRHGTVLRSTDGGIHFRKVYTVSRPQLFVRDIQIVAHDANHLLIATEEGGLLETHNGGETWRVLRWFPDALTRIVMPKETSETIHVVTSGGAIEKTIDGGNRWERIAPSLAPSKQDLASRALPVPSPFFFLSVFSPAFRLKGTLTEQAQNSFLLLLASPRGLFRSEDGGITWKSFVLPDTAGSGVGAGIIHPYHTGNIFAAVKKNLYESEDGGISWRKTEFDIGNGIEYIFIHPLTPSQIGRAHV